jgi:hypothetical protein
MNLDELLLCVSHIKVLEFYADFPGFKEYKIPFDENKANLIRIGKTHGIPDIFKQRRYGDDR